MKTIAIPTSALIALLTLAGTSTAQAIDISAVGTWTCLLGPDDLQAGAGTDLISTAESSGSQMSLTISNTVDPADSWRVRVRRSDTAWAAGVQLFVRRTSDGTGSGSVSGGAAYAEVTALDVDLCDGAGDRSGMDLQLKLTGLSVQAGTDAYGTSVTFTVVDLP